MKRPNNSQLTRKRNDYIMKGSGYKRTERRLYNKRKSVTRWSKILTAKYTKTPRTNKQKSVELTLK